MEELVNTKSIEQVQMEELIQFVRETKPEIPTPLNLQTRSIWSSLKKWFKNLGKADSGGYRWAEDEGMNFGNRLMVSVTTSLVTAINGDNARVSWKVNGEWKMYPKPNALRPYEDFGNKHNQAIYELVQANPTLKYGSSISITSLLSLTETKIKSMGYSNSGISSLEQGKVLSLINNLKNALDSSSDLTYVFTGGFSGPYAGSKTDYDFLDEYIDAVLLLNSKEEMKSYTEQIYDKINTLSGIKQASLKNMVSIALCSINLWVPND